jgi:hypothetical protein
MTMTSERFASLAGMELDEPRRICGASVVLPPCAALPPRAERPSPQG